MSHATLPSSDSTVAIEILKKRVQEFCEARDWDQFHSPKNLAIGLVTEAAELLEHFRFRDDQQIEQRLATHREAIEDELADSLFFILRFASRNGIDLCRAVENKMAKNEKKYPVDRARGSNRKYDEY